MDTSAIVTAAIAAIGLLTTAGAPLLQTQAAARHEREAHLRAERIRLYTDAMIHAQGAADFIDYLTGHVLHAPQSTDGLPGQDQITGRMWLLAPDPIRVAWLRLVAAQREVTYAQTETWDPVPEFGRPMPGLGDPIVLETLGAIAAVRAAMMAAIEAPDLPRRGWLPVRRS